MGGTALAESSPEWGRVEDVDPRIYKKVNLGSGPLNRNPEGFLRVDSNPSVSPDIIHDLNHFPWPFESSSIHEVHCSHMLEHIPRDKLIGFFSELYRVCADKAIATFHTPHAGHDDAYSDPTHVTVITRGFYDYLSQPTRESVIIGIGHYNWPFDFEVTRHEFKLEPIFEAHSTDAQFYAVQHYRNVVKEMVVTLTAHKPGRKLEDGALKP